MFALAMAPAASSSRPVCENPPMAGAKLEYPDNTPSPHLGWVDEKVFMNKVVSLGKTLYYQGDISYLESINKETLKNAYDRLCQVSVLVRLAPRSAKEATILALHPDYVPGRDNEGAFVPEGRLWMLVDRIGGFRREGKNRRDNATVSTRVLRLAEELGAKGWTSGRGKALAKL